MDRALWERLLKEMRLGWNLGNTFDAPNGETSWHNPVTTRDMIVKIHDIGFNTLRLPVSWHRHTDSDFVIDGSFLDRVNEVIDYAYDDGMYIIMNLHHDDIRFQPTSEGFEAGKKYILRIWEQLANRFEGYGERLIFEAMNEPRMVRSKYEWNLNFRDPICLSAIDYINEYNQVFVDTVRSSGGWNKVRYLMTPSYAAAPHHAFIPAYRLAYDPSDRLIVSVHSYSPIELCLMPNPDVRTFDERGERELDGIFNRLYKCFIDNDVPVIIGEMGMWDKGNPDDRYRWARYFVSHAKSLGMLSVWWDNGGREYKLFDRRNLDVYDTAKSVLQGLLDGAKN